MILRRRHFTRLAASLAMVPLAAGARGEESVVVRIGWLRAPNDLTTGKARGTLEAAMAKLGARIEWVGPYPAAAPAIEAMNAGSIDITAGSSTASVTALAAGVPMQVFAYQKMSAGSEGILVKADAPLHGLADLVGRRVAVNRGGTGEYLLVRALVTHGIDPSQVKRVYLSPPDSASAFTQGHVDAWATWDPFVTMALHDYGARLLADGAAIGSDNAVTLMASRDFVRKHPALLTAIMRVVLADNAWAVHNPREAGAIWAVAMGLSPQFAEALGVNSAVPTRVPTEADIAQIGEIANWYLSEHIIPAKPDVRAGVVQLDLR